MTDVNADPRELAKFSELAHRWWDPESEFRPLHQINPLRLDWIDGLAPLAGKRVLDVGCGGGILADSMARTRRRACSASTSPTKPLKVAQLHALEAATPRRRLPRGRGRGAGRRAARQLRRRHLHGDARARARIPASVVARLRARSSKPGGWVFFSTINRNAKAFLFAIVGAEYVLKLLPRGHARVREVHPARASSPRWCRGAGLEPVTTRGMEYNPLTRRYWLSADTSVNYLVACRKPA